MNAHTEPLLGVTTPSMLGPGGKGLEPLASRTYLMTRNERILHSPDEIPLHVGGSTRGNACLHRAAQKLGYVYKRLVYIERPRS